MKNGEVVDTTPAYNDFDHDHETCFGSFDVENDMLELRIVDETRTGRGTGISVNLINAGVTTTLLFGSSGTDTEFALDPDSLLCRSPWENAPAIRIQNGTVIQSACIGISKIY